MSATGVEMLLEQVRSRSVLPQAADCRSIRESAELSLRDVARALGVSHTAVRRWEQGARPREHRAAYADLLQQLKEATTD